MRFLIIDDSPYDRELMKRTIQQAIPTATYVEILHQQAFEEALRDLDYTMVLIDYQLKWTTGLEILKAIRARSSDLPVVMVTETGSEEIAVEAMKSGLSDYVLKTHLSRLPITIEDCLERLRLRAERQDLQVQMQQAQKMESLGLLVSGLAHDFNNLLAGIMGYAQRGLARTQQEHVLSEYFQHIQTRAEQGARMTRQLLAFARGTPMEPRYVDLNEQIASLLDLVRTLLGASVQLVFHADPALKAVYADPTQLEQVLVNLCMNARDAMPAGGNLEITTQQVEIAQGGQHVQPYLLPGSYILLRISDTGSGMDEQLQARVFEPFFTTKEVGQGTGLGLAVVYGIVKQHHGVIRVQSQPGQGTTFWLYFSAVEPKTEAAEERRSLEVQAVLGGGSETILLVEDDPDIQLIMSEMLREYGYSVLIANNGEEGLHLFEQHASSIALVIADVMMPRMQGRQFQEHVRRQRADTKVLVMSGYQEMDLKRRNLLDPGSVFLQKPFDLDVFAAKVRELIGLKRV
ncbi:MAG TPA: response regulator [Ktedonobacteraceae bacterium]